MSDAIYSPLSGREIRLLCFNKDNKVDGGNRPVCNINTVSLDSAPPFLALSYEWGNANIRENIVVGGHLMSVTSNLVAALRAAFDVSVGSGDSDNYLWADAVCINQQDIDERNSQVQMMGSIYTTAVLVICWLPHVRGLDVRHAFEAVKTIYAPLSKVLAQHKGSIVEAAKDLGWMETCKTLCTVQVGIERGGILGNVAWNNLVLLARHTYWTRVWMVQEITLAKRLLFLCPSDFVPDQQIVPVLQWLYHFLQDVAQGSIQTPSFIPPALGHKLRLIGQSVNISSALRIFTIRGIYHDIPRQENKLPSGLRWHMAISSALCQKATDPRDSIYGLLSVSDLGVIPDYRRSISDVYVEFHIKWLEHSRFLSDPAHEEERYGYLWNPGLQWSTELWFLALASKSESRQQQDPSWLLDLCSAASRESVHHLGVHPWQEDMIDFGPNARAAEIDGPTLLVDGYQVDTIASACTSSDISSLEEFLRILDGWRRNHARLAARSLLDTLIRLIWWPYRKVLCQDIPRLEDAMLVSIFLCDMSGKADVANPGPSWMQKVVDTLMILGIALDSNPTREHITNQWTDFLVRGFGGMTGESHYLLKRGENCQSGNLMKDLIGTYLSSRAPKVPSGIASFIQVGSEISKATIEAFSIGPGRYFFVTSKGYLGAAKLGVHVGDPVCALKGCPPLMVLTKEKDGYVNMGSASAVELKQLAHQEISEKIETGEHFEKFAIH